MTTEAFNKGFITLSNIFPNMNLDAKLYWEMVSDLDGQFFLMAVIKIVKETIELYPGTNLIAMLRANAEEFKVEAFKTKTLKLTAESEKQRVERWRQESSPMPESCREVLYKMGLKL